MPSPEDMAPPGAPAASLTPPGSPICHPTDLAGVSAGQVQHVEKQPQLAAQAELLLAEVVLHQAANRLQEIQHLAKTGGQGGSGGAIAGWAGLGVPPGSCSCSRRWGYGAPALQTASCCNV